MELIVESSNVNISRKNGILLVEKDKVMTKVPLLNLDRIVLNKGVNITSNALMLALEQNIDIFFINDYNEVLGKLSNEKFGSTSLIRRNQYFIFSEESGFEIAKELIVKKINRFKNIMEKFEKNTDFIKKHTDEITKIIGLPKNNREILMGYEGKISALFYKEVNDILPNKYKFSKREHQNAKEPFNILLNYSFGILYRMCEMELIKSGIDPYIGILHTDDYNKKSFLFDFIEPFRPFAIEAVIEFIRKKYVRETYFTSDGINREGKESISTYFKKYLGNTEFYDEKNYKRTEIIVQEAQKISRLLKGE